MVLIIDAPLSNPPTESFSFRNVTLYCKVFCTIDILIETEPEVKDIYYNFMRDRGMLDFVDQLIEVKENETGLRISEFDKPNPLIKTDRIVIENTKQIINKILNFT